MKKTLVIGASLNPLRYSYKAIHKLVDKGHPVLAIGLRIGEVAGVEIIKNNKSFENINTISLYLNPQRQVAFYDYIVLHLDIFFENDCSMRTPSFFSSQLDVV